MINSKKFFGYERKFFGYALDTKQSYKTKSLCTIDLTRAKPLI